MTMTTNIYTHTLKASVYLITSVPCKRQHFVWLRSHDSLDVSLNLQTNSKNVYLVYSGRWTFCVT